MKIGPRRWERGAISISLAHAGIGSKFLQSPPSDWIFQSAMSLNLKHNFNGKVHISFSCQNWCYFGSNPPFSIKTVVILKNLKKSLFLWCNWKNTVLRLFCSKKVLLKTKFSLKSNKIERINLICRFTRQFVSL